MISGDDGFDDLYGGAGNDAIYGDGDNIEGGLGNDLAMAALAMITLRPQRRR
jgi:Ca2+-binding RTX toxin-like protein